MSIDPSKYRYKILVNDAKGSVYDITSYAVKPSWEELEDELSTRMNFECKNDSKSWKLGPYNAPFSENFE